MIAEKISGLALGGGIIVAALGGVTQTDVATVGGVITVIGGAAIWVTSALRRRNIEDAAYERKLIDEDCERRLLRVQTDYDGRLSRVEAKFSDLQNKYWELQKEHAKCPPSHNPNIPRSSSSP